MRKLLFALFAGMAFGGCQKSDDGNGNSTVTVVPLPPIDLIGNVVSTTQIDLSWTDKSTNEDGFKVQRKTGTGNFADVVTVSKDVTNFNDNGLTPNTTYTYRVYAYNNVGSSLTYTNEVTITTKANPVLPVLTTSAIMNITQTTATGGGTITNDGGSNITARGIVFNISTNPTVALTTKTSDGSGTGTFTSNLTGLTVNNTYYVRAYATNSAGTAYGNEITFTTPPPTANITSLNCTGATNNGALTAGTAASSVNSVVSYSGGNGGNYTAQTINSTGVTGLTATLASSTLANGAGSLTYTITGTPTTSGTASFTLSIGGQTCTLTRIVGSAVVISNPVVSTTAVSSITTTTAISGGNVTSDGNDAVTVRGVVWSTSPNPTIALVTKTSNGTGTGIFSSNISGLTVGTLYYVRAYATNSAGTAYGNQLSFTTSQIAVNPGSVTDASGNTYPTVTIGTQVWMAENLRTTKYSDGSNIPVVTDNTQWANNFKNKTTLPMMCWYNNDQATYTANKFGALYNWYAINPATNGNKNVCPTGWHVPTDAEWFPLINLLDPKAAGGRYNNSAGGKMKSTGTQYWQSPNTGATNSSGFSGLPGGYRHTLGEFNVIGTGGLWWSSTESSSTNAWDRELGYNTVSVSRFDFNKPDGFSVRCIKD